MRKVMMLTIVSATLAYGVCLAAPVMAGQTSEKKITVNFVDADLAVVLASMFDHAGVSYALSPDVKGKHSFHIYNRTLKQALTALLSPLGMTATESDGVYVVEKPVAPTKGKPAPSTAMPQELVIVEREAPTDAPKATGTDQANSQPAAPSPEDQVAMAQSNQPYAQYPVYLDAQIYRGSVYYNPNVFPGVVILPRYFPPPLAVGQQGWYSGPPIYGSGLVYYMPR